MLALLKLFRPSFAAAPARPTVAVSPSVVAGGLIAAAVVANVLYLVLDCPHDLAPDEAHYWHWSRRLDWSYYSKGPLVAWLIRAGCELFGPLSVHLVGSEMLAVRLPAVACNALLLLGLYRLAERTVGGRWLPVAVVAAAVTLPAVNATGVLMTIDSPFLCCWVWAAVLAHRALAGGAGVWAAAGAVVAVGVTAKYTMLLFPACLGLYLLVTPDRRRLLLGRGFWLFAGLSAVGMLPVLVWNVQHDWVSFRHVAVQAGVADGAKPARFDPLGSLHYVGGQAAVLLGYWFAAWVGAVWVFRPTRPVAPGVAYLWWLSVPVWGLFFVVSFRSKIQVNWPAPAYLAGLVLAAAFVGRLLADPRPWFRRSAAGFLALGVTVALGMTVVSHYPGLIRPVLVKFAPPPTPLDRTPVRKVDPTGRLAGWRDLGKLVDQVRERVAREDGVEPVIAGMNWMVPGEVSFYCAGHPAVFSLGSAIHDRHSQYDVWRPNPVADAQAFRGRTFVYVGEMAPFMFGWFDRVERPVEVITSDGGVPVAAWRVWVGRGFRGTLTGGGRPGGPGY